ncbi:MAG: RNA-binding transcriptional accessory protein [Brevinematales bacterium]|nr:RNA-binding transcriptional accessory protein [Brevinematales bacterium]
MEFTADFIEGLNVNPVEIVKKISEELSIPLQKVNATINLLKSDNTIPFIARYRKEVTGNLTETEIREISHRLEYLENLEKRRIEIIKSIFNQGKLSEDLYKNIMKCETITELEDIYAPYKKKKKTRGMIAIEKGLEELANQLYVLTDNELEEEAKKYLSEEKDVKTIEEAIQGAMDIVAEKLSQNVDERNFVREFIVSDGKIKVIGLKDEASSVYKMYYSFEENLKELKPHHILAINRGEKEEELKTEIVYDEEKLVEVILARYRAKNKYLPIALKDGLKRLLIPSVLREILTNSTETAEDHSIKVFSENLKHLLMQPPIKSSTILGIDPGIRTGTKAAVIDKTGKYLGHFVFYQEREKESKEIIAKVCDKYNIELIAIGNGTGSHEVQKVVAEAIDEYNLPVSFTVVSEDGASVYSASEIGVEEFPDLDVTIRGAISIARRLLDPLAELVKIDPKSLGVGLYQHDVNQKKLSKALDEVVESVVNNVGVNVNTASYSLLKYVSGITSSLAKSIVNFRETYGIIASREELKKIPGFGEKTFEQAAGFLKIPESKNVLDNTWVHPENYAVARELLDVIKSVKNPDKLLKENLSQKYNVSISTIEEIIDELKKPNRDPREDYPKPILQKGVINFEDLKVGMKVTGKVKNVVDFGAFVDIGIKETALVHISEISDRFVTHPGEILKVGDIKEFKIIELDPIRKRISLSLKSGDGAKPQPKKEQKTYAPGTFGSFFNNSNFKK